MTRQERAFTLEAQFRAIRQALQAIASLSNRRRSERQAALMVAILQSTEKLEESFGSAGWLLPCGEQLSASAEVLTPPPARADARASQAKEDSEHSS